MNNQNTLTSAEESLNLSLCCRNFLEWAPKIKFTLLTSLEDTARYAGLLLAPAEAFFALWAKKKHIMLFWLILGNFWCPVVTLVTFISNHSNFERNSKKTKKSKKENKKKFQKSKAFIKLLIMIHHLLTSSL